MVSMFSEMFLAEDQVPELKALNDRVDEITKKAVEENKKDGKAPLAPEFVCALRPKTGLWAGGPIYANRVKPIVCFLYAVAAVCVATASVQLGAFVSLCSLLLMFVSYDLYSGVLHIVLDRPEFIALPLIGQPCLEFQWHHHIPDDLCKKDFLFVCGDLNVVAGISVAIHLLYTANFATDPVIVLLIGLKLAMAYFGQFSHRSAHEISKKKRSALTQLLQKWGIMISIGDHHRHHTPPHDDYFCLIGVCNKLVSFLYHLADIPHVHLVIFLLWTVFDIQVLGMLVKATIV